MRLSHSRVGTFMKCPYQFALKYLDKLETIPTDDPQSPLILGHSLHTGIEKTVEEAIDEYYSAYNVIGDLHINEALKLEYWIPKVKDLLPKDGLHEVEIKDGEKFVGYIDYLAPIELPFELEYELYDLYDFKYSNNVKNYMESEQLHLYKYYFEKLNPTKRIRNMYFVFVPKCQIRQKYRNKTNPRDETLFEFRKRLIEELDKKEIQVVKIDYDKKYVDEFKMNSEELENHLWADDFPKPNEVM